METKLAKQILNEALNIAITKGCFGLVEVTNIVKALEKIEQIQEIEFKEITEN